VAGAATASCVVGALEAVPEPTVTVGAAAA